MLLYRVKPLPEDVDKEKMSQNLKMARELKEGSVIEVTSLKDCKCGLHPQGCFKLISDMKLYCSMYFERVTEQDLRKGRMIRPIC